ncbi:MAG: hypothetical protein U0Y10_17555 [Spirosomataceae bacterium]
MMKLQIAIELLLTPNPDGGVTVQLTDHRADSFHTGKIHSKVMEEKLNELHGQFSNLLLPYIGGTTTTHTSVHVSVNPSKNTKR